ncbi:hypothetical protein FRC08_001355 [Ceratobasidium sp. 394]|nr:hypothetical protein FRC08_001355 [Ceratobasidium sp. 394]
MRRLPPELIRRVADFSLLSDMLSLVLLDKSSYQNMIATVYKSVTLTSTRQLTSFSNTMCSTRPYISKPTFYLLPCGLSIKMLPDEVTARYSPEIEHAIINSLHATTNIRLDLGSA